MYCCHSANPLYLDLTEFGLSFLARYLIWEVLILVKCYQAQDSLSKTYVVWLWLCSLQDFNSTDYILWVYCGYIVGILWVYFGYTVGMLWVYCGYTAGILWVYCRYIVGILWVYCEYTVGRLWVYCGQQVAYSLYGQWVPPQGTYSATPDQVIVCNQPIVQHLNDNLYDSTRSITMES